MSYIALSVSNLVFVEVEDFAPAVDVWVLPTPTPTPMPVSGCEPIIRIGIGFLDSVVFCVGRYGVTVGFVLLLFLLLLLLLFGMRRREE